MRSPGRGAARVARGSLLALCCTLLALSGHVLGGGQVSVVVPMLAVAGPVGAAFVVWADRQPGPGQLAAQVAGAQVAFHVAFSFCGGTGLPEHATRGVAAMVGGHVVAGLLMTWVLSRGDAALWCLYRALSGVLRLRVARLPHLGHSSRGLASPTAWPEQRGSGLVLAAAHPRRGPPRALTA